MLPYKKIISVLAILIMMVSIIPCGSSYAETFDDIVTSGQEFIKDGQNKKTTLNGDSMQKMSGSIYNILLTAAIIIAVAVGCLLGIQFIFGSIETQVKVKETLVPFVVGCIIVFGAFTIWKLVVTLGANVENVSQVRKTIEVRAEIDRLT